MALSKGVKIGLAIAVPTVILAIGGIAIYVGNKNNQKKIDDLIAKGSTAGGMVTYVDKNGQTVTKEKAKVNLQDVLNTGKSALDLFGKVAGYFSKAPSANNPVATNEGSVNGPANMTF